MAAQYLNKTGLTYLVGKIKTLLNGKVDKDLSNVTNSNFLNKGTAAGLATQTSLNSVSSVANNAKTAADEAKAAAQNAGSTIYTATIGTSWTENEDTGVKIQTVAISGITANHTAKLDHSSASINGTSDGYAQFVEEENQYLTCITNGYAETVAGGIKFYIFGDAPTIAIPIIVEVG